MAFPIRPIFPSVPATVEDDPAIVHRWLLEAWLVRVRWGALALGLAFALPSHLAAWPLILALASALGGGNAWLARLVGSAPSPTGLRQARWIATCLDWAIALMAIALSAGTRSHALLPASLLLLVLTTGLRFGLAGLLGATLGTSLVVAGVAALHVLRGTFGFGEAAEVFGGWELLLCLSALLAGALLRTFGDALRWQDRRHLDREQAVRRVESGLSGREWELLPLLAREDLTYAAMADALDISEETVKTHVRRAADKLGTRGHGRWAVVAEARRRHLLPLEPEHLPR